MYTKTMPQISSQANFLDLSRNSSVLVSILWKVSFLFLIRILLSPTFLLGMKFYELVESKIGDPRHDLWTPLITLVALFMFADCVRATYAERKDDMMGATGMRTPLLKLVFVIWAAVIRPSQSFDIRK